MVRFGRLIGGGIITLGFAHGVPAAHAETVVASELRVLVYNYAEAPSPLVAKAEDIASKVFHEAGLAVMWETCAGPGMKEGACRGPLGPDSVFVRLLPKAMSQQVVNGALQFGFAPLPADGSPGRHAYVYFDRVEELASRQMVIRPQLLAQIMAHEIGHLLLGSNSHTQRGLMRAHWDGNGLAEANLRLSYFSRKQAERIRASVAERGQKIARR